MGLEGVDCLPLVAIVDLAAVGTKGFEGLALRPGRLLLDEAVGNSPVAAVGSRDA